MKHTETEFLAGLLHDIGQLVIFRKEPDAAKRALLLSIEGPDDFALHKAEQAVFGFDHAQDGATLLHHWHFPDLLVACVEKHHSPQEEQKFPIEVSLVHIANSIASLAEIDSVSEEDAVRTEQLAWDRVGLSKGYHRCLRYAPRRRNLRRCAACCWANLTLIVVRPTGFSRVNFIRSMTKP